MIAKRIPDWNGNSRQDIEEMRVWLNEILDRLGDGGDGSSVMAATETFSQLLDQQDGFEIMQAEYFRDVAPLRSKYPHLALYLHLPPTPTRGKGERKPPSFNPLDAIVKLAAADVRQIKAIWKTHYGKFYRRRDQESAEEIAAQRWGGIAGEDFGNLFRDRLASEVKARQKLRLKS